ALARGAVPIWTPRLEPEVMGEIEGKRLEFTQGARRPGAACCQLRADRRPRARHGPPLAGADRAGPRGDPVMAAVGGRAAAPAALATPEHEDGFAAQIRQA